MEIGVRSEIGPLREVLVHRPGAEIERMTQHDLDRVLFDDILSPAETTREHDMMVEILDAAGASVHRLRDLLIQAIRNAPPQELQRLLERVCELGGKVGISRVLAGWPADGLARGLIEGVHWDELGTLPMSLARLRAKLFDPRNMALRPVPNLMFSRDPCMAVYDHVVMGRMATQARAREPLLVAFALRWGLPGAAPTGATHLLFDTSDAHRDPAFRSLEGGDVMVLSDRHLLIGCSERTTAQTIQRLGEEALFPAYADLESIDAVIMPEARSIMHLDTILTHIDDRMFLGHEPLIAGQGDRKPLTVARLRRGHPPTVLEGASVLDVLRELSGDDVELVPCGGGDPLHQEREQWTDGANAIALGPGKIILYARNGYTIRTLADRGFEEIRLSVAQAPDQRRELIDRGMASPRTVFSFSGSELSRARGGGRCLTMPLRRDPVTSP